MINRDLNTPIWQLTIGEFLDLLERQGQQVTTGESPAQDFVSSDYVYGLDGISALFACSRCTASRIKASGVIDGAITQSGRKIVVHAPTALKLMKESKL